MLRRFVEDKLPEYMVPSAFVILDTLPLTPSGKVDRKALPAVDGSRPELDVEFVDPANDTQKVLAQIWSQVLGVDKVGIHDNFFALGGDSILTIQIIARANQAGVRLAPKQLFQHPTIAELARVAETAAGEAAEQGPVAGAAALTPIQRWFFQQDFIEPHHFNQALLLDVRQPLNIRLLQQAVGHVLQHHDALRLRFVREETGWRAFHGAPEAPPVERIDLPDGTSVESAASAVQASLDLAYGPLLRVVLFDLGPERGRRLLIAIHHLVIDGVSWRVLLADLQTAYQQLQAGLKPELPAKTTSWKTWAERLVEFAQSNIVLAEQEYWLADERRAVTRLPVDADSTENAAGVAETVTTALQNDLTRALLMDVPEVYRTQINDALLAALAQTLSRWTDSERVLIDLEGHGREEFGDGIDVSRTVGWFTTVFPVLLTVQPATGPGETLRAIKEQLRAVPQRGIGYGLLRYLRGDANVSKALADLPLAEVSFNYLGQVDTALGETPLFTLASESAGRSQGERNKRVHLLEINAIVAGGCLQVNWTFGPSHRRETIERLAQDYIAALQALIQHCLSRDAIAYTPSDFPLAGLSQEALDALLADGPSSSVPIEDIYPLSPLQEGLLFHLLYAPETGLYVEQLSGQLTGHLNHTAFERAWQRVLDRHTILRSAFVWKQTERPLQLVQRHASLPLRVYDWRDVPPDDQQARLKLYLREDRQQRLDPSHAPLMRLSLIRLDENVHFFAWTFHHILLDGWSYMALLGEVLALYEAFNRGHDLSLPQGPPYREYVSWLRRQDSTSAEAFWRQTLKGFTGPTLLGAGRTGTSAPTTEAEHAQRQFHLPAGLMSRLQGADTVAPKTLSLA
jgi:non-ribosomal peptide synthase protein (TIGR01720 family)